MGSLQSAFIPGRLLIDTAMVAGEIIASWQRKRTRGFMWNIDFAKTYDSRDWNFLWTSVKKRGLPKECIK